MWKEKTLSRPRTKTIPALSEHQEQSLLFKWAEFNSSKYPALQLMHAIPNGGLRHKTTAATLKEEGVKAGVSDIFLPYPSSGYHGIYIEMKRTQGGRLSDEQLSFIQAVRSVGYAACVTLGYEDAKDVILAYLNDKYENGPIKLLRKEEK